MAEREKESGMQSERKVGVYVCRCGGNISDHVDVAQVCDEARKVPGVVVAREDMFLCSDPGQDLIIEDLKNGTIDRVVVASCAPDLHEMTFRNAILRAGANPYVYEHANIREQVSWVHHGKKATDKAARLVAAASAKAKQLQPLEPIRVEAKRQAVVIGGGIAGDFPICVVPMLYQDMERTGTPFWSYFCQISDSTTSYGSYSGAVPNEKITWGKLDIDTPKFIIESDATIVAPLIFDYILAGD